MTQSWLCGSQIAVKKKKTAILLLWQQNNISNLKIEMLLLMVYFQKKYHKDFKNDKMTLTMDQDFEQRRSLEKPVQKNHLQQYNEIYLH